MNEKYRKYLQENEWLYKYSRPYRLVKYILAEKLEDNGMFIGEGVSVLLTVLSKYSMIVRIREKAIEFYVTMDVDANGNGKCSINKITERNRNTNPPPFIRFDENLASLDRIAWKICYYMEGFKFGRLINRWCFFRTKFVDLCKRRGMKIIDFAEGAEGSASFMIGKFNVNIHLDEFLHLMTMRIGDNPYDNPMTGSIPLMSFIGIEIMDRDGLMELSRKASDRIILEISRLMLLVPASHTCSYIKMEAACEELENFGFDMERTSSGFISGRMDTIGVIVDNFSSDKYLNIRRMSPGEMKDYRIYSYRIKTVKCRVRKIVREALTTV